MANRPELWAITNYFNPAGYQRRLANYRAFRKSLRVPLVAVELAYGADFDLTPGDADILIQLRGRDVLWQGERLLNIALRAVPEHCRHVAWVDCDLLFEQEHWAQEALRLLEQFALVQVFQQVCYLSKDAAVDAPHLDPLQKVNDSYAFYLQKYGVGQGEAAAWAPPGEVRPAPGGGWAFHRAVFEERGFYDAHIVGGGDAAMLWAAFGQFEPVARRFQMNERQRDHYLAWGQPYFEAVQGRVSHVPGRIFHLWHGDYQARRYRERHGWLRAHDFDPRRDIALDENGCWCWNSDKPQLHDCIRQYFFSRKEDG